MAVLVRMPPQLRDLFGTQAIETFDPCSLAELVAMLDARYAGIAERLTEPGGALRRWVNVFVDGEDVRWLAGVDTRLEDGVEVRIVPAIAGGVR